MASNRTQTAFFPYVMHIVQGGTIGPANFLVAFSILYYEALRSEKQYVILMALSMADALNMTAYVLGGIYRTVVNLDGRINELVTSRFCLKIPHIMFWAWSDSNAQLMLLIVSVDRFISVAFPLRYYSLTATYARRLVLSCYLWNWTVGVIFYYVSYNQPQIEQIRRECTIDMLIGHGKGSNYDMGLFATYFMSAPQFALLSIVIFGLILPTDIYRKSGLSSLNSSNDQEAQMAKQRKITKSLALSCLCTLLLYSIPHQLGFYAVSKRRMDLAMLLFGFTNFNPAANCFIYGFRHPELRLAVRNILLRKEMPPSLEVWQANQSNRVAAQ